MNEKLKVSSIKLREIFYLLAMGIMPLYIVARLTQYKLLYIYTVFVFYILTILSFYYSKGFLYVLKKNILIVGLFASFYLSAIWGVRNMGVIRASGIVTIYLIVYFIFCFVAANYTSKEIGRVYKFLPIFLFILNIFLIYKFQNIRIETTQISEFLQSYSQGTAKLMDAKEAKDVLRSFPNHMVALVEVCIPFLLYFVKFQRRKVFIYMTLTLTLFNILISQSRSAYIIFVIAVVLTALLYSRSIFKSIKNVCSVFLIMVVIIAILLYIPQTNKLINIAWHRFISFPKNIQIFMEEGQSTTGQRMEMYQTGFRIIREHPILGIGYGNFKLYMEKIYGTGIISHNVIITVWTSAGIIGLTLFLCIIFKAFKNLWRRYKFYYKSDPEKAYWFLANWIALFILLIHGQTRPLLVNPIFYLPLAVGLMDEEAGQRSDPVQAD